MKLVLVRHGESDWNKLNLFTGWTDVEFKPNWPSRSNTSRHDFKK